MLDEIPEYEDFRNVVKKISKIPKETVREKTITNREDYHLVEWFGTSLLLVLALNRLIIQIFAISPVKKNLSGELSEIVEILC